MSDGFNIWLAQIMSVRPKGNKYLDSERGIEVGKLCIDIERELFSWRKSDIDTFWVDVQLFVKYKLSNEDIEFICKMQPGIDNYAENSAERNAYAEMMRGINKLKKLNEEVDNGR